MQMKYLQIGLKAMDNRLLLNKDIYSFNKIDEAISAFSNLAEVTVTEDSKYWICIFLKSKAAISRTIDEFENYLIGITNRGNL